MSPKTLQYFSERQMLQPVSQVRPIMPRVNIENALPAHVRSLRFNQEVVAERFGKFKDFLLKNKEFIDRKNHEQLERIYTEHYEKYGSSDEESTCELPSHRYPKFSVSLVRDDND